MPVSPVLMALSHNYSFFAPLHFIDLLQCSRIFNTLLLEFYAEFTSSEFLIKVILRSGTRLVRNQIGINPLNPELNLICYLLALLGAHHFLHVSRIRVTLLTFRLLMSYIYIYGAPFLDVSRSHTTTQHSR